MTNLNELKARRELINNQINHIFETLNLVDEQIETDLKKGNYEEIANLGELGRRAKAKLTIMLDKNITLEEATEIIKAQSEEPKQEEPAAAGPNLTDKERATLNALIKNLYGEAGFTDVTDLDLVNETGIPTKSMRGVLSSLSKKGIIEVDTETVKELKIDHRHVDWNSFINLTEAHYNLHPRWAAEIAENA